jgi:ribosomal protein L11 methyltransferase
LIRLTLRVPAARAELVLAELLEIVPGGVEEREAGDDVEFSVYGAPGELPELPELRAAAGGGLVDVSTEVIPDDWHERWREFHRPIPIEPQATGQPAIYVRPPWEPPADSRSLDIVIDPGQAFGTGAHATTRLSLELLLVELAQSGPVPVLDVGTGSGVLAIAAARLGCAPVRAFDNDPLAVEAAKANAAVNDAAVSVARGDLRAGALEIVDGPETLVLANLLRPLLIELAAALVGAPRALIVSGLLCGEADEVAAAFAACGVAESERREREGWAALLLRRR